MPPPNVVWAQRPCVRPETLLTRYLAEYLTHFHQTYVNDALWDIDERFTFWGQKVKRQGHSGMKYAGNSTFRVCWSKVCDNACVNAFTTLSGAMPHSTTLLSPVILSMLLRKTLVQRAPYFSVIRLLMQYIISCLVVGIFMPKNSMWRPGKGSVR